MSKPFWEGFLDDIDPKKSTPNLPCATTENLGSTYDDCCACPDSRDPDCPEPDEYQT